MKYVIGWMMMLMATPALATEVTPTLQMGIGYGSYGMRIAQPINEEWAILSDWQQILLADDYFDQDETHLSLEARRMIGKHLYLRGGIAGMRSTHLSEGVRVYETGYGLTGGIGSRFNWGPVTAFVDYFGLGFMTNHWATYGSQPANLPSYYGEPEPDYGKGSVFHGNFMQVGLGVSF